MKKDLEAFLYELRISAEVKIIEMVSTKWEGLPEIDFDGST